MIFIVLLGLRIALYPQSAVMRFPLEIWEPHFARRLRWLSSTLYVSAGAHSGCNTRLPRSSRHRGTVTRSPPIKKERPWLLTDKQLEIVENRTFVDTSTIIILAIAIVLSRHRPCCRHKTCPIARRAKRDLATSIPADKRRSQSNKTRLESSYSSRPAGRRRDSP